MVRGQPGLRLSLKRLGADIRYTGVLRTPLHPKVAHGGFTGIDRHVRAECYPKRPITRSVKRRHQSSKQIRAKTV